MVPALYADDEKEAIIGQVTQQKSSFTALEDKHLILQYFL